MTEYLEMSAAVNELLAEDEILILCHKNPDGDTIGRRSLLGFAGFGQNSGSALQRSDPSDVQLHDAGNLQPPVQA